MNSNFPNLKKMHFVTRHKIRVGLIHEHHENRENHEHPIKMHYNRVSNGVPSMSGGREGCEQPCTAVTHHRQDTWPHPHTALHSCASRRQRRELQLGKQYLFDLLMCGQK